jgi:Ca2+-binding RTX toxin-like protein
VQTGAGKDRGWGGPGNDTLFHRGSGIARLWGQAGNDSLNGGRRSRNFLFGGAGNDSLRSVRTTRTVKIDRWDCGKGRDRVMYRIRHMKHCEKIDFPNLKI